MPAIVGISECAEALSDLPDDVRQTIAPHADAPSSVLDAIGRAEAKRQEAKGAQLVRH